MDKQPGGTAVFARRLIEGRGVVPTDTRVRRMETVVHRYSLNSPEGGYDRLRDATALNFKQMEKKLRRARSFVKLAEKKRGNQGLNKESFEAEVVPVKTAISLHGSLKQMFNAAIKAADNSCFIFLNIATSVLSGRLEDALMHEGKYPANDVKLFKAMVEQRILAALRLYDDISRELSDVPEKLGVALPPRPPEQKI